MTKAKPKVVKASLKLMGRTTTATGKTLQEAIEKLKPSIPRGVGLLSIESNGKQRQKIIQPANITGLFGLASRIRKEIAIKNVLQLFPNSYFE
jgi:hypothetical protein